jgi:excisionase family DNA binding protein
MTDFFSTTEIGEKLGVTSRRVAVLVKAGRIPAVRHGRCYRIPRSAWETYLAAQAEAAMANLKGNECHADAA